ncbi:MAG: 6-phosphogluconolactonase [Chloroflexota bacterium]|nr:6-phosphogluconolactonase [Chloroflexota bacterium]
MTSEPELAIVKGPSEAAALAAGRVATALAQSVAERGRADWATTGGSAALGIYRHLVKAPLRDAVPWGSVHVWWGDDRYVPRDHPRSNVKPFDDVMLAIGLTEEGEAAGRPHGVPLPIENLHPFRTGESIGEARGAAWCAANLADELRAAGLPDQDGWPIFDLVLLGVGADGHVLSVFPGSAAFDSRELALAIPAPTHVEPKVERVTLNPAVLGVARHLLVVVGGNVKAAAVAAIFGDERDPRRWPGQLARHGRAVWILDEACAPTLRR